jgi:hypothetical protein
LKVDKILLLELRDHSVALSDLVADLMGYLKRKTLSGRMGGKCIAAAKLVVVPAVEVLWLFVFSERKFDLSRTLVRLFSERNEPSILA